MVILIFSWFRSRPAVYPSLTMSHRIIRLKVRLIDEINLFDEGRARKIIYGLDSRKNLSVRDIRQDLTRKLGLNNQLCDVEIWIGDYLVPGWTSSLVFKEDDDVQIKWENLENYIAQFASAAKNCRIVEAGKTVNDDGDYLESENGQAELESLQAALAAEDVLEAKQDGSCPAVGSPTVPTAAGHFVRPKFQPSFGPYGMGMSAPSEYLVSIKLDLFSCLISFFIISFHHVFQNLLVSLPNRLCSVFIGTIPLMSVLLVSFGTLEISASEFDRGSCSCSSSWN